MTPARSIIIALGNGSLVNSSTPVRTSRLLLQEQNPCTPPPNPLQVLGEALLTGGGMQGTDLTAGASSEPNRSQ